MTSKQVKNQVRDSVEQGFDCLHGVADVVTFPLAPVDGAIHGTARGMLNWLTDTHPKQHKYGGGGGGCGGGGGGGRGGGGSDGGYPASIDPNRRVFKLKGNEISDNKGDGNKNKDDNAVFNYEDNKIKGNGANAKVFNNFGNEY